jgi:hypothetical protein
LTACGEKKPPFLPEVSIPLKVKGLQGKWEKGTVTFTGEIVPTPKEKEYTREVTGCRIYYARYPVDRPPCEGCPIDYTGYKEIEGGVVKERRFHCQVPFKRKEGVYFFQIRLIGPKGAIGPPSERVKLS